MMMDASFKMCVTYKTGQSGMTVFKKKYDHGFKEQVSS